MHVHLAKAKRDQTRILEDPEFVAIAETASTRSFFLKVRNPIYTEMLVDSRQISRTGLALQAESLKRL